MKGEVFSLRLRFGLILSQSRDIDLSKYRVGVTLRTRRRPVKYNVWTKFINSK